MKQATRRVVAIILATVLTFSGVLLNVPTAAAAVNSGNSAFLGSWINYGIVANEFFQQSHMQTNFAVGKYINGGKQVNGADVANDPGNILIGEVVGGLPELNGGTQDTVIVVSPEITDVVSAAIQQIHDYAESVVDNSTIDTPEVTDMNNYELNVAELPDSTVYLDADQIVSYIANGGMHLNMRSDQTVVFNVTLDEVNLPRYSVTVEGEMTNAEIAENVIWNIPRASNLKLSSDGLHATVIAPRADVYIQTTGEGWLVCNRLTGNSGEWHFIFQRVAKQIAVPVDKPHAYQLRVEEQLSSEDIRISGPFEYAITFTDKNTEAPLSGYVTYVCGNTITDTYGVPERAAIGEGGQFTFSLSPGEYILFLSLDIYKLSGKTVVLEQNANLTADVHYKLTQSPDNDSKAASYKQEGTEGTMSEAPAEGDTSAAGTYIQFLILSGIDIGDETPTVTPAPSPTPGTDPETSYVSITVDKTVVGIEEGDDWIFDFIIVVDTQGEEFEAGSTAAELFADGNSTTFILTNESPSKTIDGLPKGTTYEVVETEVSGYDISYSNARGVADYDISVTVINTKQAQQPTPTPTETPEPTPTPTEEPTPTPEEPTPTPEPTEEPTPTPEEPTPTPEPTETPTPTPEPTETPTPTPEPTETPTPTPEPTETPTPTPEPTETPTPTPEPTETPTPTPEPTETPTPTPEPTETPTPTPEPTETPTPTPEPTETPTPTPEPTETPIPTPEPTETPNIKPDHTDAPTPTPEPSETPNPDENPKTGDMSLIGISFLTLFVAFTGIVASLPFGKSDKKKRYQ